MDSPCCTAPGAVFPALPPGRRPWSLRHTAQTPAPDRARDSRRDPGASEQVPFAVRVMDNAVNTYEQVIGVCSEALGVSWDAGFAIARTIDTEGSCVVCVAPRTEAERVAAHISTIGIEVRLEPAGAGGFGP